MHIWNFEGQIEDLEDRSSNSWCQLCQLHLVSCCALHNWLLEIDGMNEIWVGGVHVVISDWDGKMAGFDWEGVRADIPTTPARLSVNLDARNYDYWDLALVMT